MLVSLVQRKRDVLPPEDGAVTTNPCALVHRQCDSRLDLKVPLIHHVGEQSHDHGMDALTWADSIPREREDWGPTLVRRDHARQTPVGSVDPRSAGEVEQGRGPATFRRRRELEVDAVCDRGVRIHAPKVPPTRSLIGTTGKLG